VRSKGKPTIDGEAVRPRRARCQKECHQVPEIAKAGLEFSEKNNEALWPFTLSSQTDLCGSYGCRDEKLLGSADARRQVAG